MRRLWLIAGLVLSLAWVVGAGWHQRNSDVERADSFAKLSHGVCEQAQAMKHGDKSICDVKSEQDRESFMKGSWGNVVFLALAPIPLLWLGALIVYTLVRALLIGLAVVVPWRSLTTPKQAFVAFCGVVAICATLFGLVVAMNLYVDARVPTAIASGTTVSAFGDSVLATGTWVREGGDDRTLQTSRIQCDRRLGRCFEARASVLPGDVNTLSVDLDEYVIDSWTATTIVFSSQALCVEDVYTIDLKTDSVNGVGRMVNQDTPMCNSSSWKPNWGSSWKYHLVDGFKVYWEQRQKARPLPLRVIQASFGN